MSSSRLTLFVIAVTAAAFPLALVEASGSLSSKLIGEAVIAAMFAVPAAVVALLVEHRRPTGWLAPMVALAGCVPAVALLGDLLKRGSFGSYAVALSEGSWPLLFLAPALLLLFFPVGRVRGRDRWLAVAIVAEAVLFIAVGATYPADYTAPYAHTPHVFGELPHVVAVALAAAVFAGLPAVLVLTLLSLVRRFRRSEGLLRAQMLWLVLGGMLVPLALLAAWASYLAVNVGDQVVFVGLIVAYAVIPIAIGFALLRPDLFDVNRALASTATHAVATAVVLAIFTTANAAAGLFLSNNSVVLAVSVTSLCALLLAPLRSRLQRRVDRWFYPARRAATAAIETLAGQTATSEARPEQLEEVLQRALGDPTLRVGFLVGENGDVIGVTGRKVIVEDTVPVLLGRQRIGVVGAARTSHDLLRHVAVAAAPIVEVIRLRLGLQQALLEVQSSRARMLRAGYEERQRLERDLHDGAQLRLVSLGMALRVAQRHLRNGGVDVDGLIDQAVAELGTAVSELRQLAHGIRPSCLDDGLAPALSVLVDTVPIPVEMRVSEAKVDGDLETTAYYVASEAIANAVKHSRATRIALHVDARGNDLYVRVEDDGVGGAEQREGSGLTRLADRVGAHGGTLLVSSPANGGTTVEAILPCAS
jgi:signal transduction histidine kinase